MSYGVFVETCAHTLLGPNIWQCIIQSIKLVTLELKQGIMELYYTPLHEWDRGHLFPLASIFFKSLLV